VATVSFKITKKCAQALALMAEEQNRTEQEVIVQALEKKVQSEELPSITNIRRKRKNEK